MLTRLAPVATLVDTTQQSGTTSVSKQTVTFSWHLCNRRDEPVESHPHTHAKRTIIWKTLPAKSNKFAFNQTENTYSSNVQPAAGGPHAAQSKVLCGPV